MTFRFGMFAASTSVLLAGSLFPQSPIPKKERNSGWTATVQVLVRDKQGTPLAGLGPDDFILTEMGTTRCRARSPKPCAANKTQQWK